MEELPKVKEPSSMADSIVDENAKYKTSDFKLHD
jgi:hypothetical protein